MSQTTRKPAPRQRGPLPAVHGAESPQLAASALYHAAGGLAGLGDDGGAERVRGELKTRYLRTYHGARLVADGAAPKKKDGK